MSTVDELIAAGRLESAADACSRAGDHTRASTLYEQACAFGSAAREALIASEWGRAMTMAVLSGDEPLIAQARAAVTAAGEALAVAVAADLGERGRHGEAARLWRAAGQHGEAARAFERASLELDAAASYELAAEPAAAARVLEGALLATSDADSTLARARLGVLYVRHGKHRAAVRALGPLRDELSRRATAPFELTVDVGAALWSLVDALAALGLGQAKAELASELQSANIRRTVAVAEPDTASRNAVERLFGRYAVVREVAVTPHARLLECDDTLTGRRVALKIFAAQTRGSGRDALERFQREAKALAQLRHPHVVSLLEYHDAGPALVMEWAGGGSLDGLLKREPLSPRRAFEVAVAVLRALEQAHRIGIVHRDIKPSNVLFDEGGNPMLADFGAAHLSAAGATVTAAAIGTLAYMSPEQKRGVPASALSDIYGVGVLLHEMLTGRLPSDGKVSVRTGHPDLDESHDTVVAQFLAPEPDERHSGALAAREALEGLTWTARTVLRATPGHDVVVPPPTPVFHGEVADAARLRPAARGVAPALHVDGWLERQVRVLSLEAHRVRASLWARAAHPALAMILRVAEADDALWVEAFESPASAEPPLNAAERVRLREALVVLHDLGGGHGAVDRRHVVRCGGAVFWAFPTEPRAAEPAEELATFDRLV